MKILMTVMVLSLGWGAAAFADGTRYELRVDGLACPFCAYGIEKKLTANGKARKAAKNPMPQMVTEVHRTRWFQAWAVLHARANSGSVGHARPGRYMSQPENANIAPDPANTQALYRLSVIR